MNSNITKEASANRIISKSVKELTKNLSSSGVKLKGGVDDAVKQVTKTDFGLAGLAGGAAKSGVKAVGKGVNKALPKNVQDKVKKVAGKTKPISEAAGKARKKFDTVIADIDMKGGALGHKIAPGKSKELFVQKKKFELEPKSANGDKMYIEHEVNSMAEPLRKARNVAVPVAGGMYFNDKLEKMKYNPLSSNDGEKKTAKTREQLIDKVAYLIQNDNRAYHQAKQNSGVQLYVSKMTKLASDASVMLKQASETQSALIEKIACLEEENKILKDEKMYREKDERSEKLADDMVDKGIIKMAECASKRQELIEMDDQAFDILRSIVDNMSIQKVASEEEEGVSSLMYISGESTKKEKKTMLDSFL